MERLTVHEVMVKVANGTQNNGITESLCLWKVINKFIEGPSSLKGKRSDIERNNAKGGGFEFLFSRSSCEAENCRKISWNISGEIPLQ